MWFELSKKTKELVLDSAAASALDSEDTELSEEMVWDWKTVSSQHHSQFQLWKLWNLMQIFHTFPYYSMLLMERYGKGFEHFEDLVALW